MVSIPATTVIVPLASEEDAEETCTALERHLEPDGRVVVVYVVEKAGGGPDSASVEQREDVADRIFQIAHQHLDAQDRTVDSEVRYGTDVADTIYAAVDEFGGDLVVFSPREASRLARFLSGDVALDLITDPKHPVLVLPSSGD